MTTWIFLVSLASMLALAMRQLSLACPSGRTKNNLSFGSIDCHGDDLRLDLFMAVIPLICSQDRCIESVRYAVESVDGCWRVRLHFSANDIP